MKRKRYTEEQIIGMLKQLFLGLFFYLGTRFYVGHIDILKILRTHETSRKYYETALGELTFIL